MGIDSLEMAFNLLIFSIMNYVTNLQINLFLIVWVYLEVNVFDVKLEDLIVCIKHHVLEVRIFEIIFFVHGFDRK
jgi:hypothetical protein